MSRVVCPTGKLLALVRAGVATASAIGLQSSTCELLPTVASIAEVSRSQVLCDCHPTLRHVPQGCLVDALVLISNLLKKTVEHRDRSSMLEFLLMPTIVLVFFLTPVEAKKICWPQWKLVRRASRWIADPTPAA